MTSLSEIYSAILTGVQNLNLLSQSVTASTISSNVGQLNGIIVNGEIIAWPTAPSSLAYPYGNFRAASSGYGGIWYNDGQILHLMTTAPNTAFGPPTGADIQAFNLTQPNSSGTFNSKFNAPITAGGVQVFIGDGSSLAVQIGSAPLEVVVSNSYSGDMFFMAKSSAAGTFANAFSVTSSGEIAGRTDGSAASAGTLGQVTSVTNSSGTSLTSGVIVPIATLTPGAGNWLVMGTVTFIPTGGDYAACVAEIALGSTSASVASQVFNLAAQDFQSQAISLPTVPITLTGSSIVYMMAQANYAAPTTSVTATGTMFMLRYR